MRPETKVVMITAYATVENAVEAIRKGASEYIAKPFKIHELLTTVRRVLEEATFEENIKKLDFDQALSSVANPIRRIILKMIQEREQVPLMDIKRELGIQDAAKVDFHVRILKEAGLIGQSHEKNYSLTPEGIKTLDCLKTMEQMLQS